jgi:predicted regulator of Ras-like GTPase activity (Roadblock/LC7/MglB family)
MDLKKTLEETVRSTRGGVAAFIMDKDGLVVEEYRSTDEPYLEDSFVEFLLAYRNIKGAADNHGVGLVREMSLETERYRYLFRGINRDYTLALATDRGGYHGESSWRVRQAITLIEGDFVL